MTLKTGKIVLNVYHNLQFQEYVVNEVVRIEDRFYYRINQNSKYLFTLSPEQQKGFCFKILQSNRSFNVRENWSLVQKITVALYSLFI